MEEHLYISLTLTLLSCSACSLMSMCAVFFRHARNNCYQKKSLGGRKENLEGEQMCRSQHLVKLSIGHGLTYTHVMGPDLFTHSNTHRHTCNEVLIDSYINTRLSLHLPMQTHAHTHTHSSSYYMCPLSEHPAPLRRLLARRL